MRRPPRALVAAGLLAAALAALLVAWFVSGWADVRAREREVRAEPVRAAAAKGAELARQIRGELNGLLAREIERPYFHYQNLFHDPRGTDTLAVAPSPIAGLTEDDLVLGYFQLDARGAATTPTVNDDVPELSEPTKLAEHQRFRAEVARGLASLAPRADGGTGTLVAQATAVVASNAAAPYVENEPGGFEQAPVVRAPAAVPVPAPSPVVVASGSIAERAIGQQARAPNAPVPQVPSENAAPVPQQQAMQQQAMPQQAPTQMVQLDNSSYQQNSMSNQVFLEQRSKRGRKAGDAAVQAQLGSFGKGAQLDNSAEQAMRAQQQALRQQQAQQPSPPRVVPQAPPSAQGPQLAAQQAAAPPPNAKPNPPPISISANSSSPAGTTANPSGPGASAAKPNPQATDPRVPPISNSANSSSPAGTSANPSGPGASAAKPNPPAADPRVPPISNSANSSPPASGPSAAAPSSQSSSANSSSLPGPSSAGPVTASSPSSSANSSSPGPARPHRKPRPRVAAKAASPAPPESVTIIVSPLEWRTLPFEGAPALIAVRGVQTPGGALSQGFVIDRSALSAQLAGHTGDVDATVQPRGATTDAEAAVLAATEIAPGWQLVASAKPEALAAAASDAAAIGRAFVIRFVLVGLVAALAGAAVVLLVVRAERLARERSQFAAAAAHELRTPLAGLQLYGDMLADGLGDPGKLRDYARRMSEEAARLGRVVSNVLGFSQLERGNLSVEARAGNLGAALRELAERAEPALDRAGAALSLDVAPELPARFDRDALARIVGNLLDNAEKYSRDAEDRTISLVAAPAPDADFIDVTVSDHGPGIAQQTRARLFRPFSRGVTTDGPAGLGLGLALSQSLAAAMGGSLDYRASPSGGATFVLRLARASSSAT